MKLSIIIPAYNEELRLPVTLEDYAGFFAGKFGDDMELIVVVNHCSDDTEGIVRKADEIYPQICVVVETARIGKGGAVELGMRQAKGDLVGFVDADGSTPPEMFFKLSENIGDSGCIIGSRWIEGAVVSPKQSWMRRLASRILNKVFVHGMFGLNVHDSQCGAKLFRRDVLEKVLPELTEPGWAFDIDLLCRVKRLDYGIREFPIEWHHVPGNPINFMLMSLQMLASVWRVKKALSC
ncbi:dolichyl-phosphate beta-glucosyltransferase [Pontiella sulfatireligans]|uniref:dolichyl-phosphate beta-glucosyltransferase n=1 Tax=Pontiella sulfatireligans TaxID=2750658 RepID=A0A6C2UM90_9BACT|nr:dolichyl-phosphate beta-glucosyltransferase [Pontiella sulfatireligans]VGO21033.1 Undecaprenyl-phosphate mannosyltransferase [Pontiella sulfatireligans]